MLANIVYNFSSVVDEEMTQKELENNPTGQNFIEEWTWPKQHGQHGRPRFRRSIISDDYFYVRLIDHDCLLGIGAIRIHWNKEGTLILDTHLRIVHKNFNFEYEGPRYDVDAIIQEKLYRYLMQKIMNGRNGDCPDRRPCPPPPPPPRPPHPPKPCPPPPKPNLPKNGPYGGVYNAWDDVDFHPHRGDYDDHHHHGLK